MAKSASGKGGGPARIRFVMLDAEAPDGDLSQITQAVQNALRSPDGGVSARRLITNLSPKPAASTNGATESVEEAMDVAVEDAEASEAQSGGSTRSSAPRTPRKGKMPTVLALDLTSGVLFADFARPKNPTSIQKKHLVVAAWFKLHRNEDTVTVDHVYTCYRSIGWSCNIPDFAQALRELKHDQLLEGKGKGIYAINHLGLDKVDKLKGE